MALLDGRVDDALHISGEKIEISQISWGYRKISRITNTSGLVVQRNQTLRLMEILRTRLDNLSKRL